MTSEAFALQLGNPTLHTLLGHVILVVLIQWQATKLPVDDRLRRQSYSQ